MAASRVIESGELAQGTEVRNFENEFSERLLMGAPCVAVSSGTAALHLALLACHIGPGDEVILPTLTFAATANAVVMSGATPVFADVDPETFCLDGDSTRAAITSRTRAVIPVHLYGHPADMTVHCEIAKEFGLEIIEDAAQAHGAQWQGAPVGAFGAAGAFSFYATKNMTCGEGGLLCLSSEEKRDHVTRLRNQGMADQYVYVDHGYNYRMTDIQAAIARVQLRTLHKRTIGRRSNAAFLTANLRGVTHPTVQPEAYHVFHQYTVRIPDDRDGFMRALRAEHLVDSRVYYPLPLHRVPRFHSRAVLSTADIACQEVLSLPVHPRLNENQLERIVMAVNTIASAGA